MAKVCVEANSWLLKQMLLKGVGGGGGQCTGGSRKKEKEIGSRGISQEGERQKGGEGGRGGAKGGRGRGRRGKGRGQGEGKGKRTTGRRGGGQERGGRRERGGGGGGRRGGRRQSKVKLQETARGRGRGRGPKVLFPFCGGSSCGFLPSPHGSHVQCLLFPC